MLLDAVILDCVKLAHARVRPTSGFDKLLILRMIRWSMNKVVFIITRIDSVGKRKHSPNHQAFSHSERL